MVQQVIQRGKRRGRRQAEYQFVTLQPHHAFGPTFRVAQELPYRQRVEKLVGENEKRAVVGQAICRVMPNSAGHAPGLGGAQDGRCLDQMHLCARLKPRHPCGCTQDIGHQRAATRAKLCQGEGAGRALVHPDLRDQKAQQLSEHLADLWRSGEIACLSQRVTRYVIAMARVQQALRHIFGHGDRPLRCDLTAQDLGQRGHAGARVCRARKIKANPTAIIGSDSTCPMLTPDRTQRQHMAQRVVGA